MKEDGDCGYENVVFYFGWVEFDIFVGYLDVNVLSNKKYKFEILGLRFGMEIISFY